ncbi:hypothetical protein JW979_03685, partial [bacterium]|nr:hypothetical protein [candidate division CSSED10-310 bacterium]
MKPLKMVFWGSFFLSCVILINGSVLLADVCETPDNGLGTVDLPAPCSYTAPLGPMMIIDGLPPGTTLELDPEFSNFACS